MGCKTPEAVAREKIEQPQRGDRNEYGGLHRVGYAVVPEGLCIGV